MPLFSQLKNLSRFAKFAWFIVAYNVFVIVWGALVRASKSGDGCGSHYPFCNGEVVPLNPTLATIIEFAHRVSSGLSLIFVLMLVIAAFSGKKKWLKIFPNSILKLLFVVTGNYFNGEKKSSSIKTVALLSLFFILVEAAIGAFLVKFQLVADNVTLNRAIVMSFHLVNTLILLAFLTLTAWFASGGKPLIWRGNERKALFAGLGIFLVALVGMSGAVSALGNTLYPGHELSEALRQPDVSLVLKTFVWLELWHPFLSVLTSIYLIALIQPLRTARNAHWTRRFADATLLCAALQMVCGAFNLFLMAPIWLQLLHLLLAELMWIALILLSASTLTKQKFA